MFTESELECILESMTIGECKTLKDLHSYMSNVENFTFGINYNTTEDKLSKDNPLQ